MIRLPGVALVCASLAGLQATGPQEPAATVERARAYVGAWQQQLSGLVAQEDYVQHLEIRLGRSATRRLRSDILLVRVRNQWVGFRDIAEVDGRPIAGRTQRLEDLFVNHPLPEAFRQAQRISDEGARYNLGSVYRNFNVPTTALQILEPQRTARVEFRVEGEQQKNGRPAIVVTFRERESPTLILDKGARQYVFSHGKLWTEPATGRILATEMRWRLTASRDAIDMEAASTVSYRPDPKTGVWVPADMTEKYETAYELLDCHAVYTGIRSFSVAVTDDMTSPQ
jgi:hypothetical protein